MKQFTQVNNMISREWTGNGSGMDRVKSRITPHLSLIAMLMMLVLGAGQAWGQLPYNTTMTSSHYSNSSIVVSKVAEGNRYVWNDNGVRLGYYKQWYPIVGKVQAPGNWDDKYIVIALKNTSIPYQLKFKYYCTAYATPSDVVWYVSESEDNVNWTEKWSSASKSESVSAEQVVNLSKNTKYIKLCYSGNYAGTFKDIQVTDQAYVHNPKVGDDEITELNFGSGTISSGTEDLSFDVEWCNIDALSVSSNNETYFTVSPASFGSKVKYGTQTVTVSYDRNVAVGNNHSGTITISNNNATYTKTVTVTGTTTKRPQEIHWNASLAAVNYTLNAEESLTGEAIATADNKEAVITYTSSNSDVIAVSPDGKILSAVSTGTATITASATGSNIYTVGSDSKLFTVTAKKKQTITWEQNLMGLKTNANPKTVNLNATATSNGTITYSIEAGSEDCITLGGTNNSVMTITGTPGTAYIKATQAGGVIGDEEWIAATAIKQVKVRNPNSACDEYAISDESFTFSSGDKTSMSEKVFNLSGRPTTLTFKAKRGNKQWAWSTQKNLFIEQYANFGSGLEWKQIDAITPESSENSYGPYTLEPTATKIRFSSGEYAEQTVRNINSPRATVFEVSETSITDDAERNVKWSKTISVTRSNIDVLDISITSADASCPFQLSKTSLGTDCADMNTETFEVFFTPTTKNKTYTGTITITDGKASNTHTATIPLSVKTVAFNQAITWNFTDNQEFPTTNVPLVFNATTDATGLEVSYRLGEGEEDLATLSGGTLTFTASGTIHVIAYQEGSDRYNAAPEIEKTIIVNKVTPTIATNPSVSEIKYKGTFANSQLSEGLATVTLRGVKNTPVAGTFTWTSLNGTTVNDAQGSHNYSVTFTPTDEGMYNPKTFTQSVTISRADGGIEMNDGSVKVKVAGINDDLNECKIDLDDLVEDKIVDAVANRAGTISYEVISENKAFAAIDDENKFSATKVGTYTIRATQAQTDYYEGATDEFTVTVNKLTPTIVFDNTDDPEIVYSGDEIKHPAYRMYNGKEIDRVVSYVSSDMSNTGAIAVVVTTLTARNVTAPEGSAVEVTITASTTEDALYEAAEVTVTHNYAVRAKRSPVFTMEGVDNAPVSKILNIGEQAIITYNENTNEFLTVGTASEHSYVSYVHEPANRRVIVTAVKGTVVGDGVQEIIVNQPGDDYLFPRQITYTFTVKRNVSVLSLQPLTTSMEVEDTVTSIYTGLANTAEAVQFSCSPAGSMKYEDGKLIALQAGENTVTFSQPATEYWTGISVSKDITVSKKNPGVTTELANRHAWYSIIEHPFKSLNTEKALSIKSGNESLAKYIAEEDKIYVYGTSGNVTFTVNQDENYKYNAVKNYQKTFEIFQPNNRLPFTLTSSNLEDYQGGGSGSISWNGGGVVVGSTSTLAGPGGWEAKSIILKFVGVPNKLSFDFENTSGIATQYGWHFYQSSNGSDWNLIKEYQDALMNSTGGTSEGSESNLQLDPATQYIKLEYHGNYGGRFKNVHVTERKEIAPRDATKDFGLGYNGNEPTMRAITVDWYNVKPCMVTITGTDADKFVLDEGSKTINSQLDHYGTVDLKVSYKHETNSETTHTATLHIEDEDGYYADVTLTGQTNPAPQTIIWRNDLTPMPIEGSFQNAAMVTTGQAVTLVSDHPEIVRVVDNTTTLVPVSAGTARVTATAAGNDKWAETTGYLDIEVTTLKVQYITWTDNLSNIKREDGQTVNITLTATSSAGLPITYELDGDAQAFASISGNVLSLTGWGSGQVIAKQVGNEEYVAVQATKTLVSRNPNAKCRPLVGEYKEEYTLHTLAEKIISLNGEPDSVTFWAKCDASALWGMWVAEEYDGFYHDVQEISRLGDPNITSSYQHYSFPLHRNATAVKLYTKTGATMTRTFKEVEVLLAKYLELAENTMNFSQVDKGSTKTQSFYINYSNLTGVLDVEMENTENTQFTVLTPMVGEDCGDIGQSVRIDISCTGSTLGTENNTIIVHNADQSLSIPVSATVVLPSQTITWDPELNVLTTDEVTLNATATSELPVSFTSGNTDIAEVVYEAGVYSLDIKSYGDVAITAHQAGNENWSAATDKTLTYHISRVAPSIITNPTATGVVLPNTLAGSTLEGGSVEGDIAGTFRWQDATISVTKGVATYTAVFDPENDDWYETVPVEVAVPILKTPQTISWAREDVSEEGCSDVVILDATATSGLPITYHSSDSAKAYAIDAVINEVAVKKLYILKGGDVTITAVQPGDETYAAAPSVSKTITLVRVLPTIETLPIATDMYVHHFLSNSTPQGGVVKAGANTVAGVFNWANGAEVMDEPGTNQRTVVFQPYNSDFYQEVSAVIDVEVQRFAPTIIHNFTTETKVYGTKLSEFTLNGSGKGYDYTDPAHYEIDGTFAWKDENHIPSVADAYATMVFHPTHTDWYYDVEIEVPITITKAAIVSATATATMFYGQVLGAAEITNTTQGIVNGTIGTVAGTVTWDSSLDMMEYYTEGTHPGLPIRFTPTDPNYEPIEIAGTAVLTVNAGYVFDGNNGESTVWNLNENWQGNETPINNEKVVILSNVDVTGEITVDAMTIKEGVTVTVKDGAVLTIGNSDSYIRSTYGNIHVETGGTVICGGGKVKVNNFTLDAQLGSTINDATTAAASGQIKGADKLSVNGDAYFQLSLDPAGAITYGWYDFVVPFEVDIVGGIYLASNPETPLTNGYDFAIMNYDEAKRAVNGKDWNKYSGTMEPGRVYTITVDYRHGWNTLLFKKKAGAPLTGARSFTTSFSGAGSAVDNGWNGFGNGSLYHTELDVEEETVVQVYDHANKCYQPREAKDHTIAVGMSFFLQVNGVQTIELAPAVNNDHFMAPKREPSEKVEKVRLALKADGATDAADYLWVSASEEATGEYTIGRDVLKMGTINDSKLARLWSTRNGINLCSNEMPLVNEGAQCPIGLYAPQAKEYTLMVEKVPADIELYLTYNDNIIWNLTESPYVFDLTKGTTNGYGLRIKARAPQVATGVEQSEFSDQSSVRKVIIDNTLYVITPEGKMYDIVGKSVKY